MAAGSTRRGKLVVIDEVGKMELFSRGFIERVKSLFDTAGSHASVGVGQGGVVLLATIPVQRAHQKQHWLLESIRRRKDCSLFEVYSTDKAHSLHVKS